MILLPDEDEKPVAAQVHAVIGEALRQSVAEAEPSPAFAARLAVALDAAARRVDEAAGESAEAASQAGTAVQCSASGAPAPSDGAQDVKTIETAS